MSIKEIRTAYRLAAAKGVIPEAAVEKATLATILEAGTSAFHRAYFGKGWNEAVDAARAQHDGTNDAMVMAEALITDILPMRKALGAAMTTTDFPLALAQIRDRVRRRAYDPVESNVAALARRRTATDFKPLRGIRGYAFDRLKLRPEATSVEYASFGSTEDGYRVANWELAIAFSWESWVNDDLGEFVIAMEGLGRAARRNRALVIFEAIVAGTSRTTLSGTNEEGTAAAGGPTAANIVAAYAALAGQTNADGKPIPRLLTDIAVPAKWTITARTTLRSEHAVAATSTRGMRANAAFGLANLLVEPMMAEVMGVGGSNTVSDWLAFDSTQDWLEFAALSGYEAGPRTFTKLPDVVETIDEGSFDNKSLAVKVSDNIGAKVVDAKSILRIAGA